MRIHTNLLKCKGCGTCSIACPNNALLKLKKTNQYIIDQEKCKECEKCVNSCPYGAIFCLERNEEL